MATIIKNTVPWIYFTSDLYREEVLGTSYEKELRKTNRTAFIIEKVFKRKVDKLYVKLKSEHSSIIWPVWTNG